VQQLVRVVEASTTGDWGIVVVTGASGSGKSSLIRTGLLPVLNAWSSAVSTPSGAPVEAFSSALGALTDGPGPACLVVDRFEEMWSLATTPKDRSAALALLFEWVERTDTQARVIVVGVRAGYYAAASEIPRCRPPFAIAKSWSDR